MLPIGIPARSTVTVHDRPLVRDYLTRNSLRATIVGVSKSSKLRVESRSLIGRTQEQNVDLFTIDFRVQRRDIYSQELFTPLPYSRR